MMKLREVEVVVSIVAGLVTIMQFIITLPYLLPSINSTALSYTVTTGTSIVIVNFNIGVIAFLTLLILIILIILVIALGHGCGCSVIIVVIKQLLSMTYRHLPRHS